MRKTTPVMGGGNVVRRPTVSKKKPRVEPPVDQTPVPAAAKLLRLEVQSLVKLCKGFDTPRALMMKLLAENEEWDQLVAVTIDSRHYLESSWKQFRDDYLVSALLSKSPTIPTSHDRRDAAVKAFHKFEAQCAETNERLTLYGNSAVMPPSMDVHRAIHFAREYILKVLGSTPSGADLRHLEREMRFGPGSTTSTESGNVTSGAKYSPRVIDVTPRLADFGIWCLPDLWKHPLRVINLRRTSKFSTVPKNAKTDRGICIEPDLNIYVQLGIGAVLRRRLSMIGLNLDRAAEWNRYLASIAHVRRLTTLDLRGASDTIAREAVWLLCPEDWAQLLWLARVDITTVDGVEHPLEKWSSMGNGYTFELESLLFWGVLKGCLEVAGLGDEESACFGDDLIFPSSITTLVMSTLNFLGFSVNEEKTFSTGLFRESCGTDFFDGHPVRPVFFKGLKDDQDEEIDNVQVRYSYANALRRWSSQGFSPRGPSLGAFCDERVLPAWLAIFTDLPADLRFRIPEGNGDNGYVGNWDECQSGPTQVRAPKGLEVSWGGTYYREYFRPLVLDRRHPYGAYVATLAGQAEVASRGQPMRGRYQTATTRWAYTLAWPNLGPWRL